MKLLWAFDVVEFSVSWQRFLTAGNLIAFEVAVANSLVLIVVVVVAALWCA